jgi:hypothetical protein
VVTGELSYILPFKGSAASSELLEYLGWLATRADVVWVDGSDTDTFRVNDVCCPRGVRHLPVAPELTHGLNGKVAGVNSGLRHVSSERVVVADDDVRYDDAALAAVAAALDAADVVRPQNYFDPLPWHACLDSARMLINRICGGDWPGTLGLRRSVLLRAGGYDVDVLFENLEMVRTIVAAGGVERQLPDVFVRRLPPSTAHFWSQRIRQAYDEFARPVRLVVTSLVLPAVVFALMRSHFEAIAFGAVAAVTAAEIGRRVGGARRVFPFRASMAAPLWLLERAVCVWLAIASRLILGGVPYRGRVLRRAAHSVRELRTALNVQP